MILTTMCHFNLMNNKVAKNLHQQILYKIQYFVTYKIEALPGTLRNNVGWLSRLCCIAFNPATAECQQRRARITLK